MAKYTKAERKQIKMRVKYILKFDKWTAWNAERLYIELTRHANKKGSNNA